MKRKYDFLNSHYYDPIAAHSKKEKPTEVYGLYTAPAKSVNTLLNYIGSIFDSHLYKMVKEKTLPSEICNKLFLESIMEEDVIGMVSASYSLDETLNVYKEKYLLNNDMYFFSARVSWYTEEIVVDFSLTDLAVLKDIEEFNKVISNEENSFVHFHSSGIEIPHARNFEKNNK